MPFPQSKPRLRKHSLRHRPNQRMGACDARSACLRQGPDGMVVTGRIAAGNQHACETRPDDLGGRPADGARELGVLNRDSLREKPRGSGAAVFLFTFRG